MKWVICEDELAIAGQITKLVQGWASLRGQTVHISHFKSAEAFLFAYEDDKSVDLLLLDIQMGEMDGMTLARKIREDNNKVQIIFITGISDYVAEGYDVSAVHYLLKPVKEEKLYTALDKATANLSKPKRAISIDTADGITLVDVDDIAYVEALDHALAISAKGSIINAKMPLYKLEEALADERFIKTHRSYLINLAHVKRVTRTDVILDNGTALPLSRRLYKDINSALMKYITGGMS
ncbi:MAG: LytTR family DNA-binding domain-containing protein [Defluviitaleaceae bacterium]|nr:LytTR family DNA-binding domain-containing protein [Defluviitaleaceae bacterium]MCL2240426.1 LytTR family DNA-binding domain-containing protein [Defluviitaleaceae bacterium]